MILEKIKVLLSHRRQWIRGLDKAAVPPPYRGCPVIAPGAPSARAAFLSALCPTGAIGTSEGLSIDLGRCLFCGECAAAAPELVRFSGEHRMAASRREDLVVTHLNEGRVPFATDAVRPELARYFRRALKLRQVSAGGDNSCEMELNASMNVNFDFSRYGIDFVASPRHADGVVLTGPVTAAMASPLRACHEAIPSPKVLIAVGVDAISGGLFAGSRALDRSPLDDHTPDLYVPGNPTHPLSFIDGVMRLTSRSWNR